MDNQNNNLIWLCIIGFYLLVALLTLIPTFKASRKKVKLNPGGDSFESSTYFSEQNKLRLSQHFSRLNGTLIFWKNKAELYRCFHNYCLWWSIPISILIPVLIQFLNTTILPKLFLTIISSHAAIIIAFNRAFKVEKNYIAFRQGESEFYDIYRLLLDNPEEFGENQDIQIKKYFKCVEAIRKNTRNSEIDNIPKIDEVTDILHNGVNLEK